MSAKDVPNIVWCYYDTINAMYENLGMYGLNMLRTKYHDEVAEHYKVSRDVVTEIFEMSDDADYFHHNMSKFIKDRR